jgi:protein-S-isoprenylcysteine O-methyltransferase Ste14
VTGAGELQRVPPLGWLAVGLLAQKLLPGGRRPNRTSSGLAGVIFSASLGLLGWAVTAFRHHETTVDPLEPGRASRLVSDGPFRVTRNPMYVAMAGVLLATAVARRSLLGLLPAAGFALVINKVQIEAEEHAMAANFGADWEQYVATTPRWLSHRSFGTRKLSA